MSNFPGSIDDNTTLPNPGANSFTNSPDHATLHSTENDAIKAIETKLGTGSSTSTGGTVLTGNGTGTSAWGKVALAGMISGTLAVSNGGTGATTLTGVVKGNGTSAMTAATAGTDYAGISSTQTLTATAIQPRVLSSSAATITPTASSYDLIVISLSAALTINSPGAGVEGQKQVFRLKDNGSPWGITWNAIFRAVGVVMPTATIAGKTFYVGAVYNNVDSTWDVIAVEQLA